MKYQLAVVPQGKRIGETGWEEFSVMIFIFGADAAQPRRVHVNFYAS